MVGIAHYRYVWARELGTWFGRESEAWWNKAGKSKLTAAAKQHVSIYRSWKYFTLSKMVNYCAVALYNNTSRQERINLSWSHNMADLSYFRFSGDGKLIKKWKRFCGRADDKFKNITDRRIFLPHITKQDMKRVLSGEMNIIPGAFPTVFNPVKAAAKASSADQREDRLQKRSLQAKRPANKSEAGCSQRCLRHNKRRCISEGRLHRD